MVTLLSLRNDARERSDLVRSRFVTDTELTSYVNASLKELYDLLVASYADYYTADPLEFTVVSDGYSLPDDFYKLRLLERSFDNSGNESSYYTLNQFNFMEKNRYNNIGGGSLGNYPIVQYRVMGSPNLVGNGKIKFSPTAQEAGLYRLHYIPKCPTLVDDTDELNGVNGWEEYIIVDCCIKMLQKQEDDVSVFQFQKKELIARIEAMAAERDASQPGRITDARSRGGWDGGGIW